MTTIATSFSNLKKEYNTAAQAAADLLTTISNDEAWLWLRDNKFLLKPLRTALSDAEARKHVNDIWKAWTLRKDFVKFCKTHPDLVVVLAEAKQIEAFKVVVSKMRLHTEKLHSMHDVQMKGE